MQKENTKAALLLYPHHLALQKPVAAMLQIVKKGQTIEFYEKDLDIATLNTYLPALPKAVKEIIASLGKKGFERMNDEVLQQYNKQKAGVDYKTYHKKAMMRRMHECFDQLKPFTQLVKWYCKAQVNGEKRYVVTACSFSSYKPQFNFEVADSNADGLKLFTNVVLNNASYAFTKFRRTQFLLESNNEYFITGFKDFQTLDWLDQNDPSQYAHKPAELARHILAQLETDYTVLRNNLFEQNEIEVAPFNRVMLSELNNAFLMFTPQWMYDGFLIEGAYKETEEFIRNGEPYIIKRNKTAEQQFLDLLVSLYPGFEKQKNGFYYLSFADAQKKQWFLKTYHKLLELDIEIVGMDMLRHFRYSPHKVETIITVLKEAVDTLTLEVQVNFGKEKVPLNELQKNLLAGAKAVLLKDDSLGILHDEWLQQYASIIKHGKISKNEIVVARWMAITEQQSPGTEKVLSNTIKEDWWEKWTMWQDNQQQVYALDGNVKASLRPYQQRGYEWIRLLSEAGAGACLADDMGLGKTLQAISFLAHYISLHPSSKSIIVCPASLIYNWQQEIEKFAPHINAVVYHGSARLNDDWQQKEVQLLITTYGTMRSNADLLCETNYGVAVIDESHNIKNPAAQITKAVSRIHAAMRIALSGTPVVNNTFDLYSQLNFIVPGLFGSREFFKREYADPIDRNADEDKAIQLKKLTAPFVLRRTKEQVAKDLPEKIETVLWCDMPFAQRELYNEIKERIQSSLFLEIKNNGLSKSKLAVLDGMLKLRQVCNSPKLLKGEGATTSDSIKTTMLMEELSNILTGHKVLVFSQFSSMLHLLADECKKQGFAYYHFDGQTPPEKRMEMVDAFQDADNKTNLFLISLKAGNAGLTLTAADYVFIFDPWWNTAVQDQAIDRTHRIGQTKSVFAYKMVCKNSIEEKIIRLQEKKKKLSEDLVSADEGFVKSLTEEEVQYLFS